MTLKAIHMYVCTTICAACLFNALCFYVGLLCYFSCNKTEKNVTTLLRSKIILLVYSRKIVHLADNFLRIANLRLVVIIE